MTTGSTDVDLLEEALALIEKVNANLQPELLAAPHARKVLALYAKGQKLFSYGVAALACKVDDADQIARATGTSAGKARAVVETGKVMAASDDLSLALRQGRVSMDQANEIASAEKSSPGVAKDLVQVAKTESFHVFREKARRAKLEAEQNRGLAERQHQNRLARSYSDELGMVHVHLALEPHVGTPIVNRAEAEAKRLARAAKKADSAEPFERHLADAYATLLAGNGKGRATRPELVVLVSHEVAKRGWKDVKKGEVCKIPGVGPVSPQVARGIANEAFLSGVFYDGKDLRHFKRWTRNPPVEVSVALELGRAPEFDGVRCVDCGNRFHPERDHIEPHCAGNPASLDNLDWRCWPCHGAKTERDRKAGKLKGPAP